MDFIETDRVESPKPWGSPQPIFVWQPFYLIFDWSLEMGIVKKNKGGFVVPISDPKQIALKIQYCLKNYKLALNRASYAKKYIYRFNEKENSEKYFKELVKVIYEKN